MSGLSISSMEICDDRNMDVVENLENVDVLILSGGHVPTQNRFMNDLRLKERLADFNGIVIAWSAGSMNCADINIFPHFQTIREDYLDGMRIIEDITFEDSVGHEIIALNEESYIMIEDGKATLYGEAYRIKDRQITQICRDGEWGVM